MISKIPKMQINSQKQERLVIESAKVITKNHANKILKPWIKNFNKVYHYSFAVFDSYIFNNEERLKGFIDKLNEISSQDPTFDLVGFLRKKINELYSNNFRSPEEDYYNSLINYLDDEFKKSQDNLKLDIINFLKIKAKSIFHEFKLNKKQISRVSSELNYDIKNNINISGKWGFIKDLIKNIVDNNEKNKEDSYQISGIPGFYKTAFWNKEFKNVFNNVGIYDENTIDDFSKIVISYILNEYKKFGLDPIINKSNHPFEFKDLDRVFRKENNSLLDKVDFLFPGSKNIINKIINYKGAAIGDLILEYQPFDENTKEMFINLFWDHHNLHEPLIKHRIKVTNFLSPVKKAESLIKKWYSDTNNQIKTTDNFTFRAIAQSQELNITNDAFYKVLKNTKIKNEISIDDFTNFLKLSGQKYTLLKDKIKEISENNPELKLGYKIDYKIDNSNINNLLIRLKIFDNTKKNLDDKDEDQVVYINLSNPSTGSDDNLPYIRIKLISDEIQKLINNQLINIKEQDIVNLDISQKNTYIHPKYFSALKINSRNIDQILKKYSGFGLDIKDIEIKSLLKINKNFFSIISTIKDDFWKKAAPFSSSFNFVKIKTINEQLEESGILNIINDYSGAPDSLFDKKRLKNNIDGPQVTKEQVNEQLKIIRKKHQINNQGKIIDRIEDVFNNTNKEIDFGFKFPVTIKWLAKKNEYKGHGIAWKFRLQGSDIINNTKTEKESKYYNVVYDFIAATSKEKNDSKNNIKTLGDEIQKQLKDNGLVIDEKFADVKEAINTIEEIVRDYKNLIDNQSEDWSKATLIKEEEKAIAEINGISQNINNEIGPSSIVKKISEILGINLKQEEIYEIKKEALLFSNLLKITKNKKIFEELLKNKELLEKLSPFSQKSFLKDALKSLFKISSNYKYVYLGVGLFSGFASLAGFGSFASLIRASKRLKRIGGTQAKIKGIKLISTITAFVTLGSVGASIVTMIWFFITKGGL